MKDFKIFNLNEYESYVLLVSNEDIYFLYDKLKQELDNQKIIIDLFYRNGVSFNRFSISSNLSIYLSVNIIPFSPVDLCARNSQPLLVT